jgi:predicted PurR-regulated permease PerM
MATYPVAATTPRGAAVMAVVVAIGILYLAKEVLVPLALAILLSFLLAPAVRRLEQWRLGRIPSTLVVVILCFSFLGAVIWVAGNQSLSLVAKLPEYRENIIEKIRAVRGPSAGRFGQAAEVIKDLEEEASPERPPIAVKETPATPYEALAEYVAPFAKPVGTAFAVIIFTILFLLNRENMRERVIALIGTGRINLMTRAMGEASYRVSRYLYMQLVVNALFGIPFGIALYFIGIPNALLWGLLAVVLRFIPYAGVWIAVAMPAVLAFAISDDWSMVGWTLGAFFALELILVNAVEPWLYGRSAGLSPIAIILAAIFWTWLWGPIGLLLATPLTVCVAVMGRYIPELGYLNVLLGVEPVLEPEERFYHRLIALDAEEAFDIAEKHAAAKGLADTFDTVLIPALSLVEIDRRKKGIEPARERYIFEHLRNTIEDLETTEATPDAQAPAVCIIPADDTADYLAALMLARLLSQTAVVVAPPVQLSEIAETIDKQHCKVICISAVPPHAATHAGSLARRLRKRFPDLKIVVGLWTADGDIAKAKERLVQLGVNDVVPRLADALAQLQPSAKKPPKSGSEPDKSPLPDRAAKA